MGGHLSGDSRTSLVVLRVPYTDDRVSTLVAQVQQEYVHRYGGPDATPVDPDDFAPPSGTFLLGESDARPVAMAGLRGRSPEVAEIKRMYVVPDARRRGLARQMLAALEGWARQAGYHRIVLETGSAQPEALALYAAAGYTPVEPFGHYRCHPDAHSLGRVLDESPPGPDTASH